MGWLLFTVVFLLFFIHVMLYRSYRPLTTLRTFRKHSPWYNFFVLLFGFLIGIILPRLYSPSLGEPFTLGVNVSEPVHFEKLFHLRCLVAVHPLAQRPQRHAGAIMFTYGRDCNQTMFYTKSAEVKKEINEYHQVFLINTLSNIYYFRYFQHILLHASELPSPWTAVVDEQTSIFTGNARRLLQNYNSSDKIIFGRVEPLAIRVPFVGDYSISLQGGIIISRGAIDAIRGCKPSLIFMMTGARLLQCALEQSITIIDPIDEENMHLFNIGPMNDFLPHGHQDGENHGCCSDYAVTFGQQSHGEIRVSNYASKMKVFGRHGFIIKSLPTTKPNDTAKAAKAGLI